MDEILPLPPVTRNYISKGPYIVSFEWEELPDLTVLPFHDLEGVLFAFHHVAVREPGSPARRVVVDGRGVVIYGWVEDRFANPCYVMSGEVAARLLALGMMTEEIERELAEHELEMMWLRS